MCLIFARTAIIVDHQTSAARSVKIEISVYTAPANKKKVEMVVQAGSTQCSLGVLYVVVVWVLPCSFETLVAI